MDDEDKYIINEFRRTMSKDTVEICGLHWIKDDVSRWRVYNELLKAKEQEPNIQEVKLRSCTCLEYKKYKTFDKYHE